MYSDDDEEEEENNVDIDVTLPTYYVANVSSGDHDEEDDRPENLSPHRHVERVHIGMLGSFCFGDENNDEAEHCV